MAYLLVSPRYFLILFYFLDFCIKLKNLKNFIKKIWKIFEVLIFYIKKLKNNQC